MTVISLPRVRENAEHGRAPAVTSDRVQTAAGHVRLVVCRDFQQVEESWRKLESCSACVPAQSWSRAEAWYRLVSKPAGSEAAIVCGLSGTGDTQFIWPFEVRSTKFGRCISWMGWEHANYSMGLHRLNFAREVTREDMRRLLCEAAKLIGGVNAAILAMQPFESDGVPNPFALLPHQASANTGHSILLDGDFDTLYRNRFSGKSRNTLRRKERKLQDEGRVELGWARSPAERRELLEEFFRQKSRQFAEQGIEDTFSDPRHRAYYHELASRPSGQSGTLEIGYLKVNETTAAISCGMFFKDKFYTLLTSIDEGPVRRHSPGSLLLHFQIEEACRRGLNFFDMGAGDARHKDEWCDIRIPLFDTAIAINERGYFTTLPHVAISVGKRFIKTHPQLWSLAQTVRRGLYGQRYA